MNNEPVGVVCEFEGILVGTLFEQLPDGTPLYTHPADLTDEEITEIAKQYFNENLHHGLHFARAILKKASEKNQ